MRNIKAINKLDVINNQRIKPLTKLVYNSIDLIKNNTVFKSRRLKTVKPSDYDI